MADEVIRGLIDIRERASKKVRALRRELETLGGKAAVKTQKEITKLEREIGKLGGSTKKTTPLISKFTAGIAKGNLIAMAGAKAMSLFSDAISGLGNATLLAARVDVLNTVVTFTGKNAGYSAVKIRELRDQIISLGITERHSLEIMQRFIQAELDVADAVKVARLAQDAATIAGVNSSEAAIQMTDAINKLFPRLLKQFGIMVDLNRVYADASQALGKSADSLTAYERKQALLNATLAQGKTIAGVYETAMLEPGKRLTSLARHAETAALSIGQHFTPALGTGVDALTNFLQIVTKFSDAMAEPADYDWMGELRDELYLLTPAVAENLGILKQYNEELERLHPNLVELPLTPMREFGKVLYDNESSIWNVIDALFAWANASVGVTTASKLEEIQTKRLTDEINKEKQARLDAAAAAAAQIRISPFGPDTAPLGPELLGDQGLPELFEFDMDEWGDDFSKALWRGVDPLQRLNMEAGTATQSIIETGDAGERAGYAMESSFLMAANALGSLIGMAKSGSITFAGFLRTLAMIPGPFQIPLAIAGSVLPFDDPVNDSALIRETRRIGTFLAKGFAQSAFKPRSEPAPIYVTINAAGMSPDEIFDQLARLQRTGFIQE